MSWLFLYHFLVSESPPLLSVFPYPSFQLVTTSYLHPQSPSQALSHPLTQQAWYCLVIICVAAGIPNTLFLHTICMKNKLVLAAKALRSCVLWAVSFYHHHLPEWLNMCHKIWLSFTDSQNWFLVKQVSHLFPKVTFAVTGIAFRVSISMKTLKQIILKDICSLCILKPWYLCYLDVSLSIREMSWADIQGHGRQGFLKKI